MAASVDDVIKLIKTQRLLIRAFGENDPLREWCCPSDRENWTFPYEPDRCAEYYGSYAIPGCGYRAIALLETGEVIGRIGLTPRNMFFPPQIELCYALVEDHRGKGYMTEAAKAMLLHVESVLSLDRVFSRIELENIASQRVAEKIGLLLERAVVWRDCHYRLYWRRWKQGATEVINP